MMIRLAKRDGFRTINVVRRRELVDELKKFGADEVICEADESIALACGRLLRVRECAMRSIRWAERPARR